jgi:hypothetical protein
MGSVAIALVLTGLGALGTALGGLLVVIQPNLSFKRLGAIQVGVQHMSAAATHLHSRPEQCLRRHKLKLQIIGSKDQALLVLAVPFDTASTMGPLLTCSHCCWCAVHTFAPAGPSSRVDAEHIRDGLASRGS